MNSLRSSMRGLSSALLQCPIIIKNIYSTPKFSVLSQGSIAHYLPVYLSHQNLSTLNKSTQCWNCQKEVTQFVLKCPFCSVLQSPSNVCFFSLFDHEVSYDIDSAQLKKKFITLQTEYHPDKFSNNETKEKSISEELSSVINKAYSVLSNPYERGMYILEINSISFNENEIQLDANFLGKIMELNEEIDDIKTTIELENFENKNNLEIDALTSIVSSALRQHDYQSAKSALQKMKYFITLRNRLKDLKTVLY